MRVGVGGGGWVYWDATGPPDLSKNGPCGPMAQRDLAGPVAQLGFNDPAWAPGPVGPANSHPG